MEYKDYYLAHHGVKGMKWGVRKKRPEAHEDYKRAHSGKSVRDMSDKELREANNRLQMERQYADLTKKKNKGQAAVKTFIATVGTAAAVVTAYDQSKGLIERAKPVARQALRKIEEYFDKGIDLAGWWTT